MPDQGRSVLVRTPVLRTVDTLGISPWQPEATFSLFRKRKNTDHTRIPGKNSSMNYSRLSKKIRFTKYTRLPEGAIP